MKIEIPEVNETLDHLLMLESAFAEKTQTIQGWVSEHRSRITKNRKLAADGSPEKNVLVLNMFLTDLLVRAIRGEMGDRVREELMETIKEEADLTEANYRLVLTKAKYRWGIDEGSKVISDVVKHVDSSLHWNWDLYIQKAEKERGNNYRDDPMLGIRNIGFKLRDLALSNFSPHFAAFDLHVTRVLTRMGWLNYGFPCVGDAELEMGNNPGNDRNYLFLHKVLILLSEMTDGSYTPVDIDRILWHFGRSMCGARTECIRCPIKDTCPTGKYRANQE